MARHTLAAVTAAALVALVLGLVLGGTVVSPRQAAVDASAPPRTTLTTPVTRGVVSQTLAIDGVVESGGSTAVKPALPPESARAVVSAVHVKTGDPVKDGQALLDVSGRPTFVAVGALSAYRNLAPGSSGPDVAQLQTALRRLGYPIGKAEVTFGPETGTSVVKFYRDRGYEPAVVGKEDLEGAKTAYKQAVRAEYSAERALDRLRRDRRLAKGAAPPPGSPATSNPMDAARVQDSIDDAALALEYAREDTKAAGDAREKAAAAAGPAIPLGEFVFVPTLPAVVAQSDAAVGAEVSETTKVELSSGALVVNGKLTEPQRKQVKAKLPVVITTRDGERLTGAVASLRSAKDESGKETPLVEVVPAKPLPAALNGQPVRVSIQLATGETESLLVPEAAVVTGGNGVTRVRVDDAGKFRDVTVALSGSGDGMVAVKLVDGKLAEGDLVVIGEQG